MRSVLGGGGGGVGGRTTLLMFSLIFSFALFYTMVGIDLHADDGPKVTIVGGSNGAGPATYTPAFAGRVCCSR